MYVDTLNELSNSQAVTATAISANVIDLGPVADNLTRDLGTGGDLFLVVSTAVACTDTGSDATLTVTLESDNNVGLSSPTVHFSTPAIPFASFAPAGSRVVAIKLPVGSYEQYLGIRYTIGAGPLTAGAFDAFLTEDVQAYRAYADRTVIAAGA
jgi:hypothetical protein